MNKNNQSTFILTAGLIVLIILTVVSVYNILPRNKESDSFYVKVEDDMSAKIESIESKNGKLDITTSGDAKEFCVKPTKSTPDINNICWNSITFRNIVKNKRITFNRSLRTSRILSNLHKSSISSTTST